MTNQDRIHALACRPNGVSNADVQIDLDMAQKQAGRMLRDLTNSGKLFRGGAQQPFRWFATQNAASAYVSPGLFKIDGLSLALIEVCSRPIGATVAEARAALVVYDELVSQRLAYLTNRCRLFRGGDRIPHRWFVDQKAARDYVQPAKLPRARKRSPRSPAAVVSPHGRSLPSKATPHAINPNNVKPQVIPTGTDHRFTVNALPAGYVSQLDVQQCRPWARAFEL
jgi:hypothetical protein